MLDGSSVASILGYGAIGLGFLLALLTYRLLRQDRTNHTPIYVFEAFCFALVLVGAILQFYGSMQTQKHEDLQARIGAMQAEFARIADMVPTSIEDLQAVNGVLTGNSCEGGNSGKPLWAGRGTQAAARSTRVIGNLAAAKRAADGFLPRN